MQQHIILSEVKGILSPSMGMNLFRGCIHGCIYCDSRSKCYQINHPFTDIEIKSNALTLLEDKLKHKRKKGMIGMGSMTDPYMPLSETLAITRQALEIIYKYDFGITLITKSNLVLNDLDLLKAINKKTKCVIQMTLTTSNDELCKIIEPYAPVTSERVKALKILNEEGIPTVVWLSPFLPYINDNLENVKVLLNYCSEAHVKGIICFGIGLTLREGNREYFYLQLDKYFPGLKDLYIKKYGDAYMINSPNNDSIMAYLKTFCSEHHLLYKPDEVFSYLRTYESNDLQIKLDL